MHTGQMGAVTLIFTRRLIDDFGTTFPDLRTAPTVRKLFEEGLKKNFWPVVRSKSASDFRLRWKKAIISYSQEYDQIYHEYLTWLGPSRFRVEYIKQVTETSKELTGLPFASHDLNELFRRHVANSTNAAARYSELLHHAPQKVRAINLLLRTSNYGLTLLVMLLDGELSGPVWVMSECSRRTSEALTGVECMPELRTKNGHLSGSLTFEEGVLDVTPEAPKSQ